jgi:tetratricopeptide (TPR) repeat protein
MQCLAVIMLAEVVLGLTSVQAHGQVASDRAIGDTDEAIRLDPNASPGHVARVKSHRARRGTDSAIRNGDRIIRHRLRSAADYNDRGWDRYRQGEYDKAIADFNVAIRLDHKFTLAYNNRGIVWHDKGEYDKALNDYNEAIRLDPKFALAYSNRGFLWSSKGEYGKALADYDEAIRGDPKDSSAYTNRAWLCATCPDAKYRDAKRALESATQACKLGLWKEADQLGTLAAAYAEAGDFDAAIKWQYQAQAHYTDDEEQMKGWDRLSLYRSSKPYREQPKGK